MHNTGDEYFDSQDFRDILAEYEEAVEAGQSVFMDADDLADIADYYAFTNRMELALETVNTALDLYPGACAPLVFLAREALINNDVDSAAQYAEKIIDKENPDYKYLIAELLIAKNEIEKADRYLRNYFKTVPAGEHDDFVLDVTNIYLDYGLNEQAGQWMMRSSGNSRKNEFKELRARVDFALGNYSDSERLFNELIDENPFCKRYWNALASAQFMREDFHSSITSSEYAMAIDPDDAEGMLAKANSLFRLDNFEGARDYYQRYTEHVPDDELGYLQLAICLVNLNRLEEAISQLEKALQTAPMESEYRQQIEQEIAFTYSSLKQPAKAMRYLDMADSHENSDHEDIKVLRGHILLENGKTEDALNMFKQAFYASGNSPDVMLRIIVSLYDNNYVNTCYKLLKQLFILAGREYDKGYSYMALCCWELRKDNEFVHYLKEATKRNPLESKTVLKHLFPENMQPKDYVDYMKKKLNK